MPPTVKTLAKKAKLARITAVLVHWVCNLIALVISIKYGRLINAEYLA